ncbi:MAG TPA: LLM class flavin-dependent oxidoreductase [Caulobacteraceae bacterium]|nr:LLM class flavin-dependent oxidoreductase [Caulobacteraceae bacterium]
MHFALFGGASAPRGPDATESARGLFDFTQLCIEAEALGYHASFVTEHHFTGLGQVSDTLTLLAYVAAHTRRLRLGTAVMVLPWRNPVLLAEQAAMVDLLSGGRLDLGVGKGYRHSEFAGFDIPAAEAEARFGEGIEVLIRAFTSDQRFSHSGRYWRFGEIVVEPPPHQRPHPPIWLAAGSAASAADCARRGCNLLLNQFASPEEIGRLIALYRTELEAAGHAWGPMRVGVARNLFVADDAAETARAIERQAADHARIERISVGAESRGAHILAYQRAGGGREAHALIGTADEIVGKLDELRSHGVEYVLLNARSELATVRRFATEVMPRFASAPHG